MAKKAATPEKVVRALSDSHLTCRGLRHSWEVVGYARADKSMYRGAIVQQLLCTRCGTGRDDYFSTNGDVEKFNALYRYPKGYAFTGMPERPTSAHVWREVLRRANAFRLPVT